MTAILQAVYRRQAYPNTISVPAPRDDDAPEGERHITPYWYDHLATHVHETPFSHYQLPPHAMSSALDYPSADGYGVYDDFNFGDEEQPTRFGTAERLQRFVAIARANGRRVILDWVPHQRSGGRNGVYRYRSAYDKLVNDGQTRGWFPKQQSYFCRRWDPNATNPATGEPYGPDGERVQRDMIAGPVADDFLFGDAFEPENAQPRAADGWSVLQHELLDSYAYATRRLCTSGCRNDDTKGQAFEPVRRLRRLYPQHLMIGEYADGNRDTLNWWVKEVGMNMHTYDFNFKYDIQRMCNSGSHWDMRHLSNVGMASRGWPWGMHAVTFLENADSDTNGFGAVIFNKMLGYACMLTFEGVPSVYYRDYAAERYCYGLKNKIDNLVWIHEHLVGGDTVWRHAEYQFAVMERTGYLDKPGVIAGFNNDVWDPKWKHAYVQTKFGANRHLHDFTGHAEDRWTDGRGGLDLWIPPNNNGAGHVVYAPVEHQGQATRWTALRTIQEFDGDVGSHDILPALKGRLTDVTRIWVERDTDVRLTLETPVEPGQLALRVEDPSHRSIPQVERGEYTFSVSEAGWYKIRMSGEKLVDELAPFTVRADYMSTKTLRGS